MSKDGGPAFARQAVKIKRDGKTYAEYVGGQDGMSLRDWFAGMALGRYYSGHQAPEYIAEEVYRIADAMIAERGKEARNDEERT